ncbi:oxidoreductase domain-containing protein [hydrothermal vent metagenome]|uniref:Oxidoreductase domain-containing protein n=1 Tax=hydrothermal vent metagenome TaxID=652676 RepID=A0A3B1CA62_9ZZZZ
MNKNDQLSRRNFLGKITTVTAGLAVTGITISGKQIDDPVILSNSDPEQWVQKSDKKIRIGVVGGGFGSAFFWHQHPNCIVEAVSDLQDDRRKKLMDVYKCDKSYESLEKLVLDDKIDAVAVFTDAPSHGRHIVEVLKHGKHCITAVPLSMTLEDISKVKEWKEKTGLKVMMAETSVFRSDLYNAKLIYEKGMFGKIVYSEGEYYHPNVDTAWGYKEWRNALPPLLYPTHATAYYIGVTRKRFKSVSSLGFKGSAPRYKNNEYNNPFSSETALFETSEGGMSRINVFWGAEGAHGETGRLFGELGRFDKNVLHVGKGIGAKYEGVGDKGEIKYGDNRPPLPPKMEKGGHGGSQGYLTNEFIMALVEDREPLIDVYEAIAMTAPGIVAHQSALKNGERLTIPSFDK